MGWLLRVNRVLGPERNLATAARFATALRSLGGGAASPAQVSKWETGAARVGPATVRRYERLLGLPVNRLAAMAAILPDTTVTPTGGDPDRLPDLLGRYPTLNPSAGPLNSNTTRSQQSCRPVRTSISADGDREPPVFGRLPQVIPQ
jgi:hypothetical protein